MIERFDPQSYNTLVQFLHMTLETWAIVFCVVAIITIYPTRAIDRESAKTCILLLFTDMIINIADVFAWVYCGLDSRFAYYASRISVFTVYSCIFILVIAAAQHASRSVTVRGGMVSQKLMNVTVALSLLGITALITSRIFGFFYTFDEHNYFIRQDNMTFVFILAELAFAPVLFQTIQNRHALRKREFIGYVVIHILSIVGGVVQILVEGISAFNAANSISLVILVMVHQYEYTADVIQKERTRADDQIRLYTRQIQPHFVFNSLSAIRSYIPEDSKALESLNHFAGFLRGSIDLATTEGCIKAKREFETVIDYLYMEKERFGSDLTVETKIDDDDFMIPAFSVLTLVENAISHGIRQKEDGKGTLTIKSYETYKYHVVEVSDDGVGFDVDEFMFKRTANEGEDKHIGINNIKKRLALMSGGMLWLQSSPGKGTTARIEIPRK